MLRMIKVAELKFLVYLDIFGNSIVRLRRHFRLFREMQWIATLNSFEA